MKSIGAIMLALLLLVGCSVDATEPHNDEHDHGAESGHSEGEEDHSEAQVTLSEQGQEIAGIETIIVQASQFQKQMEVPGIVTTTDSGRAIVTPPVTGRVVAVMARRGTRVRQGQRLAVIESPELAQAWSAIAEAKRLRDAAKSDVQQAKSEVELSLAKLSAARLNLKRQRLLVQAGAFSQAPVQQARNELNDAQSELLSVQEEQSTHAEQLRRLENLYREGIVSKVELETARLELQQDEIRLERARARFDIAKAAFSREQSISSQGLLNAKELQSADAEVKASELELSRAKLLVQSRESALASAAQAIKNAEAIYRTNAGSAQASVGRVTLLAPISGVISHLDVTRGQAVDRTQVLLEIENLNSIWVTASVPEADLDRVQVGSRVTISTPSVKNRSFTGIIQVVGFRVDPKTRSIPVQCLVTESQGLLKPEMFTRVSIGTGQRSLRLAIPKSALLIEGGKHYVFAVHDGAYEKHAVEIGQQSGDQVVVLSGIEEGERIVSKGAFILSSEQKKSELKGHEH